MESALSDPASRPALEPSSLHASTLADLLARIAAQDAAALAALYDATSAKLMGVCLRILRDRSESEDVLQEVYVTVWRRAGAFNPARGVSPVTWLAVIARNRAIDRLRARDPLRGAAGEDAAMALPDLAPLADTRIAAAQDAGRLYACLDELEARTSEVIRTAFFEGVAYEALAERLGQPIGTVKSWIRRGLRRLKVCLER